MAHPVQQQAQQPTLLTRSLPYIADGVVIAACLYNVNNLAWRSLQLLTGGCAMVDLAGRALPSVSHFKDVAIQGSANFLNNWVVQPVYGLMHVFTPYPAADQISVDSPLHIGSPCAFSFPANDPNYYLHLESIEAVLVAHYYSEDDLNQHPYVFANQTSSAIIRGRARQERIGTDPRAVGNRNTLLMGLRKLLDEKYGLTGQPVTPAQREAREALKSSVGLLVHPDFNYADLVRPANINIPGVAISNELMRIRGVLMSIALDDKRIDPLRQDLIQQAAPRAPAAAAAVPQRQAPNPQADYLQQLRRAIHQAPQQPGQDGHHHHHHRQQGLPAFDQ